MDVGARRYKLPVSVLVIVHTPELEVLLIERADRAGFLAVGDRKPDRRRVARANRRAGVA